MTQILEFFSSNPQFASNGVFFLLFIAALYFFRKDSLDHKKEYKSVAEEMFKVVRHNTESNTKLTTTLENMDKRIK